MPDKPDPARLAAARELYLAGATSVAAVAASLGLNTSAFYRLRQNEGWPLRPKLFPTTSKRGVANATQQVDASPAPARPPELPGPETPIVEADAALTDRLERALAREVTSFETSVEPEAAPAGRNARILASLVKTLAELRKLEAAPKSKRKGQTHDGEARRPPRDLAALREDLARRLAEFRRSRSSS